MTNGPQSLRPEPLTRAGFAVFGDVIEAADAFDVINSGTTRQYRKLTEIEVTATVAAQVVSGGGGMPSFADRLTETDIRNLSAYIVEVAGQQ